MLTYPNHPEPQVSKGCSQRLPHKIPQDSYRICQVSFLLPKWEYRAGDIHGLQCLFLDQKPFVLRNVVTGVLGQLLTRFDWLDSCHIAGWSLGCCCSFRGHSLHRRSLDSRFCWRAMVCIAQPIWNQLLDWFLLYDIFMVQIPSRL